MVFFVTGCVCLISDLCGVRLCCRLSESHASPHRPQVCQQSGGHQILRSGHVSQTRVLKTSLTRASFSSFLFVSLGSVSFFSALNVVNVSLETRPGKDILLHLLFNKLNCSVCFFSTEYLTPSFSLYSYSELISF